MCASVVVVVATRSRQCRVSEDHRSLRERDLSPTDRLSSRSIARRAKWRGRMESIDRQIILENNNDLKTVNFQRFDVKYARSSIISRYLPQP